MNKSLKIEYLQTSELFPYAQNARTHSGKQISQIARSIKKFGFINPVIIDEKKMIIAGHARVLAAKIIDLNTVPIIRAKYLSEAMKRAYILADNKIAENADWDEKLLRVELEYLTHIDIDIDATITGFETAEIDVLLNTPLEDEPEDPPPPLPDARDTVTRPDDMWFCGAHRIVCGDCRDKSILDVLMENTLAQMVITDPPYNVPIDGHVCGLGKIKHEDFAMASGEMTSIEFIHFLKECFNQFVKFSTDGSLHYIFMDWRHLPELLTAGNDVYDAYVNLCVWAKTNGGMGSLYRSQHELIALFKNGTASHINNVQLGALGRYRTNVWHYPGVNAFGEGRDEALENHPTVKPVAMIADAIMDVTQHNDIVLDGFLGSGTTLLAGEQTDRRCYAVEIDPRYVDVALERWMKMTGEIPIHAQTGLQHAAITEQRHKHVTCEV